MINNFRTTILKIAGCAFEQTPSHVHLWVLNGSSIFDIKNADIQLLDSTELEFSEKYHDDFARHQFLTSRILLRKILSRYCSVVSPKEWSFQKNRYGKLSISTEHNQPLLNFSISHSGPITVFALSQHPLTGVDIETIGRTNDYHAIAEKFFSEDEFSALMALKPNQQESRFYDFWTLKESFMKASGSGFYSGTKHFNFHFSQAGIEISFDNEFHDPIHNWNFWNLNLGQNCKLAVSVNSGKSHSRKMVLSLVEVFPLDKSDLDLILLRSSVNCILD